MDDQLLNEFLAEAEEIIEGLHADLASLRARRGEGRARRELVGRIFRQVHTVKGTASSAGLEAASRLAHEFESLLDALRLCRGGAWPLPTHRSKPRRGAAARSPPASKPPRAAQASPCRNASSSACRVSPPRTQTPKTQADR